jgi:AcrR family transcriptional regulator
VQDRIEIPGESDDVRARRARDAIGWALVKLMLEGRSYDDISVQQIAEQADVGRSTFYAHFQDKDDIMVRYNVVFGQMLGEKLWWDESTSQYRFPIVHLFDHVRQFRPLYAALVRARRLENLFSILRINMAEQFEKRITATRTESVAVPASMAAHHLAASIVNLLVWWMDRHCPVEPDQMSAHFHHMIASVR